MSRAPRLTSKLLKEDLPVLLAAGTDELAYSESRLTDDGPGLLPESARQAVEKRAASLRRALAWLQGKVDAETARR